MIETARKLSQKSSPTSLLEPSALYELAAGLDGRAPFWALGMQPDPWQQMVLDEESQDILVLSSRQAGKSTVCAAKALHVALRRPGSLVAIVAPSARQSQYLLTKVLEMIARLHVGTERESAERIVLKNRSHIVALPGLERNIRGLSAPNLVIADEAARIDDELYAALRPMVVVSKSRGMGQFIAISTPYGKRGWFYRAWAEEHDGWLKIRVTALDVPRISPHVLEQERMKLGDDLFRQEYMCDFLDDTGGSLFRVEWFQGALDMSQEAWPIDELRIEDVVYRVEEDGDSV